MECRWNGWWCSIMRVEKKQRDAHSIWKRGLELSIFGLHMSCFLQHSAHKHSHRKEASVQSENQASIIDITATSVSISIASSSTARKNVHIQRSLNRQVFNMNTRPRLLMNSVLLQWFPLLLTAQHVQTFIFKTPMPRCCSAIVVPLIGCSAMSTQTILSFNATT